MHHVTSVKYTGLIVGFIHWSEIFVVSFLKVTGAKIRDTVPVDSATSTATSTTASGVTTVVMGPACTCTSRNSSGTRESGTKDRRCQARESSQELFEIFWAPSTLRPFYLGHKALLARTKAEYRHCMPRDMAECRHCIPRAMEEYRHCKDVYLTVRVCHTVSKYAVFFTRAQVFKYAHTIIFRRPSSMAVWWNNILLIVTTYCVTTTLYGSNLTLYYIIRFYIYITFFHLLFINLSRVGN